MTITSLADMARQVRADVRAGCKMVVPESQWSPPQPGAEMAMIALVTPADGLAHPIVRITAPLIVAPDE